MPLLDPTRLWAVAKKEARQLRRDRRSLLLAFLLPLLLLVFFGYAISWDVRDIALAVVDHDATAKSRELVESFEASGYFTVVARPSDPGAARELFARGRALLVLIIPPGFAACSVRDAPLCGSAEACQSASEEECAASGCTPISGAPHVVEAGMACADFDAQVFLGCLEGGIACPPVVLTVCPEGQLDTAFDVSAGCLPPGHMQCDQPVPGCP